MRNHWAYLFVPDALEAWLQVDALEGELSASKSEVAALRKKLGQAVEENMKSPTSKLGPLSTEGHVEHTTGLSGPAPSPRIPKSSPMPSPEIKSKVVTRHSFDPGTPTRTQLEREIGAWFFPYCLLFVYKICLAVAGWRLVKRRQPSLL